MVSGQWREVIGNRQAVGCYTTRSEVTELRIDFPQVPVQGGLQVKTGKGVFADSLKEGDRVRVDVLSSERNAVVVKTEGGQVFKARLDTNAELSQGDKVLLEYSGKEGKLVFLSIIGRGAANGEASAELLLVRDFEDKSLAPFASKLAELHMTVNEETAQVMKELVASNPGMTLEEAAFLASNKLTGDENLVKAALALISDGDKTDALLARLIALLGSSEPAAQTENVNSRPTVSESVFESVGSAAAENPQLSSLNSQLDSSAPLTDWLRFLADSIAGANAENVARSPEKTGLSENQIAPKDIIPQSDTVLQSGNVIKNVEILQNEDISVEKPVIVPQNVMITQGETAPQPEQNLPIPASEAERSTFNVARREQASALPELFTDTEKNNSQSSILNSQLPRETGKVIAQLLSGLPEFHGTPVAALERFSNMLLRIAGESPDTLNDGIGKLASLLEKLFTRIEKNDRDAGERLKGAREELFARLALIEEQVSRAAPPAKAEVLEQTRRLMNHVRLLNSIDQFIYAQLPVRMGEDRKTAELYLFRKKNGKKVDPENANILLALDLENMGHWEGLINIRNKDVSIQMEVRGEGEKEFFSERTVMLHELLAEAGFRLVNTGISFSKEETTPLTALSVLDRFIAGRSGVVDVTV